MKNVENIHFFFEARFIYAHVPIRTDFPARGALTGNVPREDLPPSQTDRM
jgi:hypothetical protein